MARNKHDESEPPGIVVLYTSLMILLLAFFILLNSVSKVEETKVETVYQSLMGTFGFLPGKSGALDSIRPQTKLMNPVDRDYNQLRGLVKDEEVSGQVKLLRSKSIRSVVLPNSLLFEPGSEILSPKAASFLLKTAAIIRGNQYPVSINGYTDDAPPQRGGPDNWALSCRRALAVLRFLTAQGVRPNRLAAFGLAAAKPRAPNDTPSHRRQNNRVELVFDSRDLSMYQMPEGDVDRQLDFRGFQFDLLGGQPKEGK